MGGAPHTKSANSLSVALRTRANALQAKYGHRTPPRRLPESVVYLIIRASFINAGGERRAQANI